MRFRAPSIVLALASFVLLAYWFASRPSTSKRTTQSIAVVEDAVERPAEAAADSTPANRPMEKPTDGFVASDACKECHAEQYETWHASYHRRMTQLATPEAVIGKFDDSHPARAYGRDFSLARRGDEYWVRMDDLEAEQPESAEQVERRIVMTTGSHHMQIYWYSGDEGRTLWQLPVAWLRATQSWVPTSALFISPPPQPLKVGKRRWNEVCIKCHTTNGQPRIESTAGGIRVDTHVAEFGISCEACHGPGEEHVAGQSEISDLRFEKPANLKSQIVHPAKLDHKRSSQVCGQCHGNWLPNDQAGLNDYYLRGTCFRAGDDLADARHIFASRQPRSDFIEDFLAKEPHYFEDRYWKDGMIRVSGGEYNGMTGSACYEPSQMSCLSCHQMHQPEEDDRDVEVWANDQLKLEMLGQEACLQCHEQFRAESAQVAHTHHAFGSSGSECYNCHMPHTSYGLLKAIRSHQVSVPSVEESTQLGRPNACNQCHVDKTLAWTGEQLESWYGIRAPTDLTLDQKKYSATALWCLTGDAGQRALAAWTLGWSPAQEASRTDWTGAILAQMLADPYDAVRHIAHRSLRTLPSFQDFEFHYPGPPKERQQAAVKAFRIWQRAKKKSEVNNATVLLTEQGELLSDVFTRLNHSRDNKQVLLAE